MLAVDLFELLGGRLEVVLLVEEVEALVVELVGRLIERRLVLVDQKLVIEPSDSQPPSGSASSASASSAREPARRVDPNSVDVSDDHGMECDDPSPERVHAAEASLRPAGIDPVICSRPKELCGHSARNMANGPGSKGLVTNGRDSGDVRPVGRQPPGRSADFGMAAAGPHRLAFDQRPGAGSAISADSTAWLSLWPPRTER